MKARRLISWAIAPVCLVFMIIAASDGNVEASGVFAFHAAVFFWVATK